VIQGAIVEICLTIILAIGAFWLGACPFAVWIGRWKLHKDIRAYGDHNPGAANVFRAGSIKWGVVAGLIEVAKGMPFVMLAHLYFLLSEPQIYLIALCPVAGHAFSPFLKFKGGKATAATFGVLLAIPPKEFILILIIILIIGFLLLEGDGWRIFLAVATCLIYAITAGKGIWLTLFLASITVIIALKNRGDLKSLPSRKKKIYIGFGQEK